AFPGSVPQPRQAQDPCAALSWTNDFDWDLTQDTVEINFMVADVCMHSVSTSAFIIQSNDSDTVLISSVTCDETLAGFDTVVVQNGSCIFMTVNQILFHPPDTTVFYSITCDLLQAGSDIIHLQNQYGCDSLVIQNRVFEPTDTIFQMTTTCSPANVGSDTTVYAGQLCDSMVIVITDILASDQTYLSFATCDSTLAGADTIFLTNHYGCDSLVIIVTIYTGGLTIVDEFTSLCGNGVSFQDSMVVPGNPCDSLVITHFSFTPLDTIFHEEFTCDPSGVGTFENTVPGKQGCDSTTFTTLVYSPPDSISIIEHNCFGLDTFIESVVYNNQYGCDSLYVIYYTYNVAPDTQFVQQVTCDSFQTGIETITLPGEFCDTVMIIKTSFMAVSTSSDTLIVCGKQGKDVDSLIFNTGAGCDSILIRHYQYIDIKSEISITDESCKSIGDGTIQINSIEGGLPPYVVSLNNGAWQENLSFNSIAPGFYSVFIRDMNGCIDSMSQLEIQAGQDFNVNIGSDIKAKAGDLVNLSVVSNELIASMLWVSVDSLTCNACPNPVLGPLTVGQLLSFHAISELGCPGFDELDIRVEDDLLLYIPNSFSPNEDGINDVFYASGHYFGSMAYRMTIFDRWGNMVYHNDNLTIGDSSSGWNGIFKDQPVAPGVYIYVLGLHLPEKVDKWYTGDITLIR
ncbi:MAG: gliding motility-associated C-terminal domain-containing protein, partial [Saprospiraceae bacterium]